jgi:hypothetical protein
MAAFSELTASRGVQCYYWFSLTGGGDAMAAFRGARPGVAEDRARDEFSRDSLVDAINELAAFAREVKPGAKVAIHVYPVFLPEPLYGNRLDVDYCCQTVAWFFEPYWSREKIVRYTRAVVGGQNDHYPRPMGIPFVGIYVGRRSADKSPERLFEELATVRAAGGTSSLSVHAFNDVVAHPAIREAMLAVLGDGERTTE